MSRPTEPLREEHRDLFPHIEEVRRTADAVGRATPQALAKDVGAAHEFLARHLIPHALAEDAALYPVVARVMGAPQATATMSRDHVEVGRLTEELAGLHEKLARGARSAADQDNLRRVLYGLYTLVKVHFAKEEEIYLPLLDQRLTVEEARRMFADMEAAAARAKSAHGHAERRSA